MHIVVAYMHEVDLTLVRTVDPKYPPRAYKQPLYARGGYSSSCGSSCVYPLPVQQPRRTDIGITIQHWSLWELNLVFTAILLILLQTVSRFVNIATDSKREKVLYGPQKDSKGVNILIRSTENSGERGNPFSTIGRNAKSVTMRSAEIQGNTRRESTTRILSILCMRVVPSRHVFP